jgi:hypothetical protein
MESIVFKWILSFILFLLYTLLRWVRFNKLSYFHLELSFFLIYISWLHMRMRSLWILYLIHYATTWRIVSLIKSWRRRTISLIDLIDFIFLKNRKLEYLVFEVILLISIKVTKFGYFTTVLIIFTLFITHTPLQFSYKFLILIF